MACCFGSYSNLRSSAKICGTFCFDGRTMRLSFGFFLGQRAHEVHEVPALFLSQASRGLA